MPGKAVRAGGPAGVLREELGTAFGTAGLGTMTVQNGGSAQSNSTIR